MKEPIKIHLPMVVGKNVSSGEIDIRSYLRDRIKVSNVEVVETCDLGDDDVSVKFVQQTQCDELPTVITPAQYLNDAYFGSDGQATVKVAVDIDQSVAIIYVHAGLDTINNGQLLALDATIKIINKLFGGVPSQKPLTVISMDAPIGLVCDASNELISANYEYGDIIFMHTHNRDIDELLRHIHHLKTAKSRDASRAEYFNSALDIIRDIMADNDIDGADESLLSTMGPAKPHECVIVKHHGAYCSMCYDGRIGDTWIVRLHMGDEEYLFAITGSDTIPLHCAETIFTMVHGSELCHETMMSKSCVDAMHWTYHELMNNRDAFYAQKLYIDDITVSVGYLNEAFAGKVRLLWDMGYYTLDDFKKVLIDCEDEANVTDDCRDSQWVKLREMLKKECRCCDDEDSLDDLDTEDFSLSYCYVAGLLCVTVEVYDEVEYLFVLGCGSRVTYYALSNIMTHVCQVNQDSDLLRAMSKEFILTGRK